MAAACLALLLVTVDLAHLRQLTLEICLIALAIGLIVTHRRFLLALVALGLLVVVPLITGAGPAGVNTIAAGRSAGYLRQVRAVGARTALAAPIRGAGAAETTAPPDTVPPSPASTPGPAEAALPRTTAVPTGGAAEVGDEIQWPDPAFVQVALTSLSGYLHIQPAVLLDADWPTRAERAAAAGSRLTSSEQANLTNAITGFLATREPTVVRPSHELNQALPQLFAYLSLVPPPTTGATPSAPPAASASASPPWSRQVPASRQPYTRPQDSASVPVPETGSGLQHNSLLSDISYLPAGAGAFLFRPWPWSGSTSLSDGLARIEDLFWPLLYAAAIWGALSGMRRSRTVTAYLILLVTGLVVSFGLSEGNAGTAFRHRAQLLPALAILAGLLVQRWHARWDRRRSPAGVNTSLNCSS